MTRLRLSLPRLALLLLVVSSISADAETQVAETPNAKVSRLIKQLGSPQYLARVRAQQQLQGMGLTAFDSLHQAQNNDDIEIAMRARFLVQSMRIDWAQQGDTSQVRRILKGYGRYAVAERQNRMERLAQLKEHEGLRALCRLVRYESDSRLSKRAALLVMNAELDSDEKAKKKAIASIRELMGNSQRVSSTWLRTFADTLRQPEKRLAMWAKLAKQERLTLSQFPAQSSRHLLRDLYRWRAKLLQALNKPDEYLAVARKTMSLLDGTEGELNEMVDWLMDRKTWSLVEELSREFSSEFSRNSVLLYRLAESRSKQGRQAEAEKTAVEALAINPNDASGHLETASALRDRGLMKWSINEYQHVISKTKPGASTNLYARLTVSEILHDFDRDLEAAKALQGIVDVMERPEVSRQLVQQWRRDLDGIRSRMNYFFALHQSRGDRDKARAFLEKGLAKDPFDPDILIAMHRFQGDAAWKKKTKTRIETAIQHFRSDIKKYRLGIAESTDRNTTATYRLRLAHADNQMAWLVGNTIGDIDEAIHCSHESLKLRPNQSAYLDTLGRCYFTKRDYANAVKYQKAAVDLEPTSAQIRRQLGLFRKALADSQKKPK